MLLPKLQIGGAEAQVFNLVRHLDRSRFFVSICSLIPGNAGMERDAARYVDAMHCIGFRWRRFPLSFAKLTGYLNHGRFHILHAHLPLADSIGRIAAKMAGVPVIMTTEHGQYLWKNRSHLWLERVLNHITDMRICVSRDVLEIRHRRERTPMRKLIYIPNGVDTDSFNERKRGKADVMREFGWHSDDPLIVSVGRLVREKNYPLLLEAVSLLRSRLPNIRCLLAGEGKCREEIEQKVRALDLGGNIHMAGSRSDVPSILEAANLFVMSSDNEGLPVALLEAMAAGKAIVATSVGGIPDAIRDGENGFLVRPGDGPALASAMERVILDVNLAKNLGRIAAEDVGRDFHIRRTSMQVMQVYESLYRAKCST
jgi:glycosyltransferase involved in cell wall biosynthesis